MRPKLSRWDMSWTGVVDNGLIRAADDIRDGDAVTYSFEVVVCSSLLAFPIALLRGFVVAGV